MVQSNTLLITRSEVSGLLSIEECMYAVEGAFKMYAEGKAITPKILGVHVDKGGFHIKAGVMNLGRNYFVAKTNANFPDNMKSNGLPTIQGVIVVSDADNGKLLALMDSMEITIIRTGAATGVASKYLSRKDSKIATIYGCGNQGKISIYAIAAERDLETIFVYDIDFEKAKQFADDLSVELPISIRPVEILKEATIQSDIIVTCTPSRKPFLGLEDVKPGTFIAAVGSDNEDKQELHTSLMASCKLVTDLTSQCVSIGELHHAIDNGVMHQSQVYAELGEIIAGQKSGRTSDEEIIIFDSTGTALQDVATAAKVYERALAKSIGKNLNFGS